MLIRVLGERRQLRHPSKGSTGESIHVCHPFDKILYFMDVFY